jgi:hypothetical protein
MPQDARKGSPKAASENKPKEKGTLRHKGKALGTYSISEDGKKLTNWLYAT